MNKRDFADNIGAQHPTLTKKACNAIVDSLFNSMNEALARGETVQIIGFGSFKVADRAARVGKNPKTGEKLKIAARKVVKFAAGKALKDDVNSKKKAAKKPATKAAAKPAAKAAKPAAKPAAKKAAAKPAKTPAKKK